MKRLFKLKKDFGASAFDLLVVGLGNPGLEYEGTRHSVGFAAMDALCEKYGASCNKMKFKSYIGEAKIGEHRVLLCKPLTYMNLSGEAVAQVASFYKIPPEKVLVMFDDISLDPGVIRLRRKGSAGGHNGIKNIILHLGTEDFPRIKIGVGAKPHPDYDLIDWVLGHFKSEEQEKIDAALEKTVKAVAEILSRGMDSAMNKYSR